jgi:ElaB/YqjD/DUF883 family membrane-anchored ribosome-binding protein
METTEKGSLNPGEGIRTAGRTVDQATARAHTVIDKATEAARPMVDRAASGAHQAVDRIAGVAGQAAETLGAKGEQLMDAQTRAMEQCRGYVRDNPLASLGIAIAAGFVLSRLLSWNSR